MFKNSPVRCCVFYARWNHMIHFKLTLIVQPLSGKPYLAYKWFVDISCKVIVKITTFSTIFMSLMHFLCQELSPTTYTNFLFKTNLFLFCPYVKTYNIWRWSLKMEGVWSVSRTKKWQITIKSWKYTAKT